MAWPLAARCYTAALSADALCYEALDRLVNNHMLSTSEQRSLLNELEPKLRGARHPSRVRLVRVRPQPAAVEDHVGRQVC